MKSTRIALLILGILVSLTAQAQYGRNVKGARYTNKKKYYTVGMVTGSALFMGDIAPKRKMGSTDFSMIRANVGFMGGYKVSPRLTMRGGINYIEVAGDDSNLTPVEGSADFGRWKRNLHFKNQMVETSFGFTFDIVPNNGAYYTRPVVTPYAIAGVGLLFHSPKAIAPQAYGGNWVNLRNLQTEGVSYGVTTISFPLGFGVRTKVNPWFDIGFEVAYRTTITDYLDDVSGNFPLEPQGGLSWAMSSRSTEAVAAWSGKARDASLIPSEMVYITPSGRSVLAGSGYGPGEWRGGTNVPDGGSNFDGVLTIGVHAMYIIPQGGLTLSKMSRSSRHHKKRRR
ncbi:MAG: DUF6089 family protein [Flammeovirgaceae bacterium]|nr:DUF6089 family protein [Flammeovirgaceae bacterium]MDW8286514.1 DUF6089 family protein [Flammeovirgaceae bacterium]